MSTYEHVNIYVFSIILDNLSHILYHKHVHVWTCLKRCNDMYGNWNRDDNTTKPEGTFSITALARTCGVSRATILRMENEGLLKPAYNDSENSYRYYDCKSVAEVMRILNYQRLGFTKKEIAALFRDPQLIRKNIAELKERIVLVGEKIHHHIPFAAI